MEFNRFEVVTGACIEEISGQSRFGFSMSDTTDFYDMTELMENDGYKGSTIAFYDYETGKVYEPFAKERNVIYGDPVFLHERFWFLRGDYNSGKITLLKYCPGEEPEAVTQLNIEDVDAYNLCIVGEDVHIVGGDDEVVCYYPEQFRFAKEDDGGVILITDGKVYISAWVEEGWDDENDCATEDYKYYEKIIVRDFEGNLISEEIGCLEQRPDGSWWIS